MDFAFCDASEVDWKSLAQGDLIQRTTDVQAVLSEAHQYYSIAEDYKYFCVLTQSCDLVKRSGGIKAPYITIAAVRPLSIFLERALDAFSSKKTSNLRVGQADRLSFARQLSDRLLNNNEKDVFFIRKSNIFGFNEDLCVYLQLSVALRPQHYERLVASKVAQMKSIFSAKLGWMVGQLYSRVGTPDLSDFEADENAYREKFFDDTVDSQILWLTKRQRRLFRALVTDWENAHPGDEVTADVLLSLAEQVPDQKALLADRVVQVLVNKKLIDSADADAIRLEIQNDNALINLAREID